jgi:hypothetical protein
MSRCWAYRRLARHDSHSFDTTIVYAAKSKLCTLLQSQNNERGVKHVLQFVLPVQFLTLCSSICEAIVSSCWASAGTAKLIASPLITLVGWYSLL